MKTRIILDEDGVAYVQVTGMHELFLRMAEELERGGDDRARSIGDWVRRFAAAVLDNASKTADQLRRS